MSFRSHAGDEFWEHYDVLPAELQAQANKAFALFSKNPYHPSLHFKAAGDYWSVRISGGYRALAERENNEFFWFWIGPHDQYERILRG